MNLEERLHEAVDELWNSFVDPNEPYYDTGDGWSAIELPANALVQTELATSVAGAK